MSDWAAFRDSLGTSAAFLRDGYLRAAMPVPTGIPDLDAALCGGMVPGVHVLGGEPGAGKSALALEVATLAALRGVRALYVSLEMGAAQCRARCLSLLSKDGPGLIPFCWSDVPRLGRGCAKRIRDAVNSGTDMVDVVRGLIGGGDPVATASAYMDRECPGLALADSPALHDVSALEALARDGASSGLGLLVVDYMQLLDVDGAQDDYGRMSAASRRLSMLSRELGIPVLVLSALNRTSTARGAEPTMHGFRGSGGIEYDAESAWVLTRDERGAARADGARPVLLHVVKQRGGPQTGGEPVALWFDGAHNRIDGR